MSCFAMDLYWKYYIQMELSERYIQKFEDEGFTSVYEWQDAAGTIYEEHAHKGKVSLFVTDGSIAFDFAGVKKEIKANERFDVPPGRLHSAIVGTQGWIVIIGEEIEGDS
jgi:quercetin dioxygenase-like cupin family protein